MRISANTLLNILYISIFVAVLVILWYVATQPISGTIEKLASPAVDPMKLKRHVLALSETFYPRDYAHPENLDAAADYIRTEFERTTGNVEEQAYQVDGTNYRNILLHLGPHDADRIVIGAHYDAFDELPGADDNASGVAGLLELAHMLAQTELNTAVELAAFALEEPPFFGGEQMGSAVHAARLKAQDTNVRMMISLEMIGYFSDAPESQGLPLPVLRLFYPTTGNFIAVIGHLGGGSEVRQVKKAMLAASELPVYSFNAPPRLVAGIDWSDHLNYWNNGYPAVMVTDTAFFRNPYYHSAQDTAARLDYQRMAMVVQGVYRAVVELAK